MPTKPECSIAGCPKQQLSRTWCRTHYTRWYETGSTELGVRWRGGIAGQKVRRASASLSDRFWPKVNKTGTCWLWTGGKNGAGYGTVWSGPQGKKIMAHRAAWELLNGPIPEGAQIDHLCRVPLCVNPEHLEPVTPAENTRRGLAPVIAKLRNGAKSSCPQGHPYSAENTYTYQTKTGISRVCRTCAIERTQARRMKRGRENDNTH